MALHAVREQWLHGACHATPPGDTHVWVSRKPPFFATVTCSHTTLRPDCMGVWVIDWQLRQAYKISVVMATCERWSLVEGKAP